MRRVFMACLLVAAVPAARAERSPERRRSALVDPTLTDPAAFARFADRSRVHPGGAAVPPADTKPSPFRRQSAALAKAQRPLISFVPLVVPEPRIGRGTAEDTNGTGLIGKVGGIIVVSVLSALFSAAKQQQAPVPEVAARAKPEADPAPAFTEADLPFGPLSPELRERIFRKRDHETTRPQLRLLRPPRPRTPPEGEMRMPWWAITSAEQEAINRWDVSLEKLVEGKSLDWWLDAHQGELKGVNIWRLKEKLWRDA